MVTRGVILALLLAGPAVAQPLPATVARRPVVAVAGLPACNAASKGALYMVTDALAPVALATVAAAGAVSVGVTCDGTNWIVQ